MRAIKNNCFSPAPARENSLFAQLEKEWDNMELILKRYRELTVERLCGILKLQVLVFAAEQNRSVKSTEFRQISDEFLEGEIPHVRMKLDCSLTTA